MRQRKHGPTPVRWSVGVLVVFGAVCASAGTNIWTGGTGDWFEATNWANGVPGDGDNAIINSGSALLTNATAALESFTMNGGALTFTNWSTCLIATNVFLNAGVVTHGRNSDTASPWTPDARVWISCSNDLTVATGATINADGKGYGGPAAVSSAGYGPGGGPGAAGYARGGGYGGYGGYWSPANGGNGWEGGLVYGLAEMPTNPGSGGGSYGSMGGAGGGVIRIEAPYGKATVNGIITANGANASYAAGSGGGIYITCKTFAGTNGIVRALGGKWLDAGNGSGGGGGRIAVAYNTVEQSSLPIPTVRFLAGVQTNRQGDIGTLYLSDAGWLTETITHHGRLCIPGFTNWALPRLTISNGWISVGLNSDPTNGFRLTVTNDMLIINNGLSSHEYQTRFELVSNGVLSVGGNLVLTTVVGRISSLYVLAGPTNAVNPVYGRLVDVAGDMVVATNCRVYPESSPYNGGSVQFRMRNLSVVANAGFDANLAGYYAGYGPGKGAVNGSYNGGGAYGGRGGMNPTSGTNWSGITYGSSNAPPIYCGSGGGGAFSTIYGRGGGLIHIEAQETVTLNGALTADGYICGGTQGGGSGGGIYVRCRRFTGTGSMNVRGGSAAGTGWQWTAGGGGRILVMRVSDTSALSLTNAAGGTAGSGFIGQTGSVVFVQLPQPGTVLCIQ